MIPIPVFLIPLAECLINFLELLEDDNVDAADTNWLVMYSFINIITLVANVLLAYFSVQMEKETLDAHKIIQFLNGYR